MGSESDDLAEDQDVAERRGLLRRYMDAAKALNREVLALYYATRDPATGWAAWTVAAVAVGYALSPFDLIPDFIPVLGLVDDLIILPALIWLAVKLIPEEAMQRGRHTADTERLRLSSNWVTACLFFLIWVRRC